MKQNQTTAYLSNTNRLNILSVMKPENIQQLCERILKHRVCLRVDLDTEGVLITCELCYLSCLPKASPSCGFSASFALGLLSLYTSCG